MSTHSIHFVENKKNIHHFSLKGEALLMSTHNVCFFVNKKNIDLLSGAMNYYGKCHKISYTKVSDKMAV